MADLFSIVQGIAIPLKDRLIEIITAPYNVKEMLFILLPLVVVLVVIELYFGRYKYEKLGWNTAVSNSLALLFVGMNLLNYLYSHGILFQNEAKSALALIVVVESIFLLIINFFHIVPREAAFGISSPLILNYIGIAGIIMVYTNIPFELMTILAFFILFIVLVLILKLVQSLEIPVIPEKKIGKESVPLPEGKA